MRARLHSLDRVTQRNEMRKLGASPDVLVGSVHAITEQGEVLIASAVGSQLGPAAFGAGAVIWVVGTQKLVRTLEDGFRRIRQHSLPLESERTQRVYGQPSAINKLLIVNGEAVADIAARRDALRQAASLPGADPRTLIDAMTNPQHVYEVRPRKDHRGVDLIPTPMS